MGDRANLLNHNLFLLENTGHLELQLHENQRYDLIMMKPRDG